MSYTPTESSSDLWLERSYFVGGFLASVAYGFHCSIFGTCVYFLFRHPSRGNRPPNYKLLAYVTVIWIMATISLAAKIKWNEMIWIDDRNYPGGPIGFLYNEFTLPLNTVGNTSFVINNCLTDLMVLHRAWVIWSYNYYVIAIPFLAIVTSTILSILTLVRSALPGANLWTHPTFSFAVPYWSLSISINIFLTLLIIIRLLTIRNRLRAVLGKQHTQTYTSLIAIMVESASIYSTVSLIYIVAFARNWNVQNLVLPVLGQAMCIAPELIIMRAALGSALTSDRVATISNLHFHHTAPTAPSPTAHIAPIAPTAPTANSSITTIPTTGSMVDFNGGRGIIRIDGESRRIDIKSFKAENEEDGFHVTPEGSEWDVSKEEA